MTIQNIPPKITPSRVDVSVGSCWGKSWEPALPELASVRQGIDSISRTVKACIKPSEEVGALPPEHRTLRLDGLAKAGRNAINAISQAEREAEERGNKIFERLHAESRAVLATPKHDLHLAMAYMQIRERIAKQDNPGSYAMRLVEDLDVVKAVLGAPAGASGLKTQTQVELWEAAEAKHLPHVFNGRKALQGATAELARSAKIARQMVAEMTGLRETSKGYLAPWEEV